MFLTWIGGLGKNKMPKKIDYSNLKETYHFSGIRERIIIRDKIYPDNSKILARRSRDDNPQTKSAKKKVHRLTKRRGCITSKLKMQTTLLNLSS